MVWRWYFCSKPGSFLSNVEQFREEQHHTEVIKAQLDAGDCYEKKRETRERELKIRDVVLEYDPNNIPGY